MNDVNEGWKCRPEVRCIHQLFEEQSERFPDSVAVECEGKCLTYRELNAKANQLAHHLRTSGVGSDVLVGLSLNRSLEMVVAMIGILKAGGAYVPVDHQLPSARIAFILEDADFSILITQRSLANQYAQFEGELLLFDEWKPDVISENNLPEVSADHPAYVMYTSGSTGRPKGVVVEHRSVVNLLNSTRTMPGCDPHDILAAVTTISFDISVLEIFLPLTVGARVVIVPDALRADGIALSALIESSDTTIMQATPTTWKMLLKSGWSGHKKIKALSGGESLSSDLAKLLIGRCEELWNLYGPTETTVWSLLSKITDPSVITIGGPLANTRVYVVNSECQLMPTGSVGELYIGGMGVARGYLNQPELTSERFVPDPFCSDPGARIYKTGDLASWNADGTLNFHGRLDDQVKIRGHRIELGEVEAVLGGHPDVSQCAVIAQIADGGDKVLTGFVVPRKDEELSVGSLRKWLGETLPDYMVPSRFVMLPALPVTPNGKVDRKALDQLDGVQLTTGTDYLAPRNDRERALAEIWQNVLKQDRIGVRDNFFDLGGNSLLVAIICSQISVRFGLEVSLRSVFENPTIESLARLLQFPESASKKAVSISKADRKQSFPMSFAQQGMWLLDQILTDPVVYVQPVAWRLSGHIDQERVRRALQIMVQRHEILRTSLVFDGGNLIQQIASRDILLPWSDIKLDFTSPDEEERRLKDILLAEGQRPFRMACAPLWRVLWIQLAGGEQVMVLSFHHSIFDEWSERLMLQELNQLYDGAELPEPALQYRDYALWQLQHLTGDKLENLRKYWREQLRDAPPSLELPSDLERPLSSSGRGAHHHFRIAAPIVKQLRELARQECSTLFTTTLAAFQIWLQRISGQTDLVVGTPFANRQRPEIQSLLGFFLNILPIRTHLEGCLGFREVLRQVRGTVLDAFDHAELPFAQMVELALRNREKGRQPICQVMFVLLEGAVPGLRLGNEEASRIYCDTGTSKYDLTFYVQAEGETWNCSLVYATDIFSAKYAEKMASELEKSLRACVENPDQPIRKFNRRQEGQEPYPLLDCDDFAKNPASAVISENKHLASFGQTALWFVQQITPHASTFNLLWSLKFRGALDHALFLGAISRIIGRHAGLRAIFELSPDGLLQRIIPPGPVDCKLMELASEEGTSIKKIVHQFGHAPFDLEKGPLYRFKLIRLGPDDHVMLCGFHHLIMDGTSWQLFVDELLLELTGTDIPPLEVQYKDFCKWQKYQLSIGNWVGAHDYWRSLFPSGPTMLELPTDHTAIRLSTSSGAVHSMTIPVNLADLLRGVAKERGSTPFRTAFAAFFTFLHRVTGQSDLSVSTTLIGRSDPQFARLLGYFVNTGVVRVQLDGTSRFDSLIKEVDQSIDAAVEHEDYPYNLAVSGMLGGRTPDHDPFSQVSFIKLPTSRMRYVADMEVSEERFFLEEAHNELSVYMHEALGTFSFTWVYRTGLFKASTMEALAAQFQELLANVLKCPEARVSNVLLMPSSERELLIERWNVTESLVLPELCIHELFERQAVKTPESTAVFFDGSELTYRELNEQANRLANYLRGLGIKPESLVGICVGRTLDMVIAVLATLKAGGAYVPLDPAYPKERLAYIQNDAQPKVILTQLQFISSLPVSSLPIVCMDALPSKVAEESSENPSIGIMSNHPAYVIYTSGSTGRPKGVVIEHNSLLNYSLAAIENYGIGVNDRVLQFASLNFDASAEEIYPCLVSGGTLVLRKEETIKSASMFLDSCAAWRVTILDLPTAYWSHLLIQMELESIQLPSSIRLVIIGGEKAPPEKVALWHTLVGAQARLFNTYGPTEATIVTTWCELKGSADVIIPIGRPIPNARIFVLDAMLQPVPTGSVGELYIGGMGLARGYLNQPELTKERFIETPPGNNLGKRLYKTGDKVRFLQDGNLEFLGRLDNQVKIRGYRIELGEVEAVLGGHPDVSQCAVIAKIFDGGERGLTGFMVSRKDAELSVGSLREWLGETLPDYMIPSRFVMLPSLPVTPNGKVDRKALDQLAGVDLTTGTEYLPPRNDMERVLVEIWQNVLKHDRIGVRDNFFDLGGHSLLVAVICSQISDELDVEVSLRSVFEHPTVESLAEYLGNASPSNGYMPMLREAPTERVNVESSGSIESIESLLIKQRPLVAPWKGRKLFGKSFLITLNHAGLKHGLFWCLQGYRELTQLASHLGPDQPVHGMRSGHLIMDYTDANIDLLASHYALEMMALQPEGPFIIGGNCQGGLIARAIALCIKRAGRSVSLLILMEESRFQDYDGPVALLFGSESILNPYKSHSDPEAIFNKSYPGGFTVDLIDGAHGQFFEEPNIESLVKPLKSRLKNVSPSRTPDLLRSSLRYFFIKIGRHSVSWIRSTWQK